MSREIKFRAWDRTLKKMHTNPKFAAQDMSLNGIFQVFDATFEFMQFTGLLDKNGTEIYEGDIVEVDPSHGNAVVKFWEIPPEFGLDYYHNEDQWIEDWNLADDYERMEVIGNIYENPELLEQS